MRALAALVVVLSGCSRRDEVRPDPVHTPAPPPAPKKLAPAVERAVVAGVVVDLSARKVLYTLSKDPPTFEALDETSAFLVDRKGVVHAFDLGTGVERWHVTPPRCSQFTSTDGELYCVEDTHVHALAKGTGALRTIPGTGTITQVLGLARHLVVLRSGGSLESIPEGTSKVIGSTTTPLHTWPKLVRHGTDVCGANSVAKGVFAACWEPTLVPRWSNTFVLAKPGEPSTSFLPRAIGPELLVAGTWWSSGPIERSLVVRLSDGVETTRLEQDVAGVLSHDATTLDGLLSLKKDLRFLDATGKLQWSMPKVWGDSAAAATADGRLFVAIYSSGSAGAQLYAFDGGGTPAWTATPTLPPIAHSAYINHVELSIRAGLVAMHGEEAAVEYLSLFEPKTGKPVIEVVRPLW